MTNNGFSNEQVNNSPRRLDREKRPSRFKWFTLGCLSSIVILTFWIVFFIVIAVTSGSKTPSVKPNSFLHIRLSGVITEHKAFDDDIFSFSPTYSASEIVSLINEAADDNAIEGIFLEPRFISAGLAVLNEIKEAIENFQARGKLVYSYLELSSNQDYYLASIADRVFLNPANSSGIVLTGLGGSSLYLKDLLDKLGIEMTVLHAGRYKGAGEQFSRRTMSPETRESLDLLLDDYYGQLLNDLSDHRNINFEDIRQVYEERDNLLINGQYALNSGLVDQLINRSELIDFLNDNYASIIRLRNYKPKTKTKKSNNQIAVVYMQGMIAIGSDSPFDMTEYISASNVLPLLKQLEEDEAVKAVVLRINSPGGSALESDIIYQAIAKLNNYKPVVVSMSNTAASGGYYISAPASYIIADPYTLTGSIGVAAMIPNFYRTGQKIGANPQTITRGKFSNFMNIWEAPKSEDKRAMQRNLDSVYDEFIERVSSGRDMPREDVHKVAQGKIWTSKRALEVGLIDDIGSLNFAVDRAAAIKGLDDYHISIYPKTKSIWEMIMETRFNVTVIRNIVVSNLISDKRLVEVTRIYNTIKNDPIQLLTPVKICDE